MPSFSTHTPRPLLWAAGLLAIATLFLSACSAVSLDQCSGSEECFGDESCIDGICQLTDSEPDTGSDADPTDCVDNIGLCGELFCHPTLRECVECVRNDHCEGDLVCDDESSQCRCPENTHECDGVCVSSDDPDHCGDRCEPCPDSFGADASCVSGQCELQCQPGFSECTGAGCTSPCIECESHSDCTDSDRSRCYEGRCQGCALSSDCSGTPETPVCDTSTGSCIQCTVLESGACDGTSCDPATNECTDTPVRSLSFCDRCKADIECHNFERCVPMFYAGQARPDGYCLRRESLTDCTFPFSIHLERVSLSGHPQARYCGIREEKITCEAFQDFSNPCALNSECGASNLSDGICTLFSGSGHRCTHECTDNDDCHPGAFCTHPNVGFCLDTSGDL